MSDSLRWAKVWLCVALLAGVGAAVLVWASTNWGIGVSPDSVTYLLAARSLLQGEGLTVGGGPLLHYPPAYPVLLAASGWLSGSDPLAASRWVHALLFGVNVLLAGCATYRLSDNSVLAAACASALLLTSHQVLNWHVTALSEPLFIFWLLAATIMLWHYFRTLRKHWLALCGLCIGAATMTRYVGVTLIGAALLTVLWVPRQSFKKRLSAAFWLGIPALLPLLIWVVRNYLVAERATTSKFAVHLITPARIWEGLSGLGSYVAPFAVSPWLRVVIFISLLGLIIAAFVHLARHTTPNPNLYVQGFLLWWSLVYGCFLIASISFVYADITLDSRMLLLFYVVWVVGGLSLIRNYTATGGRLFLWRLVVAGCLLLSLYSVRPLSQVITKYRTEGIGISSGYTNRIWRSSGGVNYLRSVPEPVPVYTNGVDAVAVLLGRKVNSLPPQVDLVTMLPAAGYEQGIEQMKLDLETRQGIIVYFTTLRFRDNYLGQIDELKTRLNLRVLQQYPDSMVLTGPQINHR